MKIYGFGTVIALSVIFSVVAYPSPLLANCGDIVQLVNYDEENGLVEEREPIIDCANPFNADDPIPFIYTLAVAGQVVSDDATVFLLEGESVSISFSINQEDPTAFTGLSLFRRDGDDYFRVGEILGETESAVMVDPLLPGEYVAVLIAESAPILSEATSLWQRLLGVVLLPTVAHAFYPEYVSVVAVPFTIAYETPAPTGASSVIFLPGIMGSRLFEEGTFCDQDNQENQLWFSVSECKQLRLTTNFIGQSTNRVYTKSEGAGILDEAVVFNIYKTFLEQLSDWKEEEIITDFAVMPYDWRGGLGDVLKSAAREPGHIFLGQVETVAEGLLYQTIENLADTSASGKVTVVAHSNGGLVIKQLIRDLQNTDDPLLEKIDTVILVAVPQLGAPGSAIGILHGEDLDPVMSQAVTRRQMNTMPFSHHLLPTTGYFNSVETPVITIESGESTNQWITDFGSTISSQTTLHHFLSTASGRVKPTFEDLATPEVVDDFLLQYAATTEMVQSSFVPASGMQVYQVAGTGLETPSGLTYFSDQACVSTSFFVCTEYQPKISYRVQMTIDGDATVPVPSALALAAEDRVEKRWMNLFEYNDNNYDRKHRDILEVPDVIAFIANTIQSTTTIPYEYLSETAPVIVGGERLVFQLHSPLDMSLVAGDGRRVSSSTVEIESATYRRYGELQYISIPRDETVTSNSRGWPPGHLHWISTRRMIVS
jgi:hypothetical protein